MDVLGRSRYGVSLPPALRALHLGVDRDPELMSSLVESVRRHGSATAARRSGCSSTTTLEVKPPRRSTK